jgi:hypothetical protein
MNDLSKKTVMCVDNGLFVSLALRLAQDFGKVYYCCPSWVSAFPKMNELMIGYGFDEIEVVETIRGPQFDEIDLFVFPDVYFGEDQVSLEAEGKLVWGARMGEELELQRDATKDLMKEVGLPVGPWKKVKGMDGLREFLQANKNQHVKVNKWRGVTETFFSKDYQSSEPKLDEVEHSLGKFKYVINFIVEEDLSDKVEIGVDAFTVDGAFPSKLLSGIEVKDVAYVGVFKDYAELPKELTLFDQKLAPTLKDYGYRGFYSTEVRIGKDHVPYMIDFCARAGSPPSELYQEFYKNISEIIWDGANGKVTDPIPEAKYAAELLIHSPWADKNWQPVDFPKDVSRFVKLRNATKIKGRHYVIPQAVGLPEIGATVGWGNTLKAAMEMAVEVAKQVDGFYIKVPFEAFDEADEEIAKLDAFGIKMFE